jgi:hypothetical protein
MSGDGQLTAAAAAVTASVAVVVVDEKWMRGS